MERDFPYNQVHKVYAEQFAASALLELPGNGVRSTMPDPKKGLTAGETAPDFTLMPALGETPVSLSEYRGQWVVLLFFRGLV